MQHEYTNVLACLVKTFPTKKEFRDMVQLTDYNDLESDFFEHMKHIQVWNLLYPASLLRFLSFVCVCLPLDPPSRSSPEEVSQAANGGHCGVVATFVAELHHALRFDGPDGRENATGDARVVTLTMQLTLSVNIFSWWCTAAREHDNGVRGHCGRRLSPADLVQVPVLPEAFRTRPADVADRAEAGCEVGGRSTNSYFKYIV